MRYKSPKLAAGALLVLAAAMQAAPATYYITNISAVQLGTLGGNESVALDVNNLGEIVGWSLNAVLRKHGFRYRSTTGLMADMTPGSMVEGEVHGINNYGQMVGTVNELFSIVPHAFYYDGSHPLLLLNETASKNPDCTTYGARAHAINDDGAIAGEGAYFCGDFSYVVPVVWPSYNAFMVDLLNLHHGGNFHAHNINSAGIIVGHDHTGSVTDSGGWYWDLVSGHHGLPIPHGTPPEKYGAYYATAYGINSSGQIVGEMPMYPDPANNVEVQRAILWPGNSQPALIFPLFSDGQNAGAREINDLNFTVGWAGRSIPLLGLQKRAAIWTSTSSITMLPLPDGVGDGTMRGGPTACEALAVSNRGVVDGLVRAVGDCTINGKRKAILWNITVSQLQVGPQPTPGPVPQP